MLSLIGRVKFVGDPISSLDLSFTGGGALNLVLYEFSLVWFCRVLYKLSKLLLKNDVKEYDWTFLVKLLNFSIQFNISGKIS